MERVLSTNERVVEELATRDCMLCISESITGGALSASITRVNGASRVLLGAQVLYSTLAKSAFCHLDMQEIERIGTISIDMVKRMDACMAKRCFSMLGRGERGSSIIPGWLISIATCGIASGSVEGKPTGLVYVHASLYEIHQPAFDLPGPTTALSKELHLAGSRGDIIDETVRVALLMVLDLAGACT